MKKILLLILLVLCSLPITSQVLVSGHIIDDEMKPISSVIVKRMRHKMLNYTMSDNNGMFSINAEIGDTLNFSILGFESQQIAVKRYSKPLTIKMNSGAIALEEVYVKSDKVYERGDTVSYLVSAFANSNDKSIGDVIAKIPGFDVDKTSGKISYGGKPISKFYIEGLDMLGGKYGVATNTLPQGEVGTVEVMRRHQPIRVLEDFTFTDDAAINIKMKDGVKSHWVTSWKMAGGYGNNTSGYGKGDKELWQLEGFGLRLKPKFQTMLTYKTNNTGLDISRESTSLYNFDESFDLQPKNFIALSSPAVSAIGREHSLFNRSHVATINVLNKLNEDTQINFQLVYNNEHAKAWGQYNTTYIRPNEHKVISNSKSWNEENNSLYALLKYEHNAAKSYLRNSLSGNMKWLSERLSETGTNQHFQCANIPVFDFKDNLYAIHRIGKTLLFLYSNNSIQNRPQYLDVDSTICQTLTQRFYSTDTYGKSGWKLGHFSLSMKIGIKGMLRYLNASANGLPDSLGVSTGKSHFGYIRFYATPQVEILMNDFKLTISTPFENAYYKYSMNNGKKRFSISPLVNLMWDVTSRISMSVNGNYTVSPVDFNRFYESYIMQDYITLNQGYKGYDVEKMKTLGYVFNYRNALKGTHLSASVTRQISEIPYTTMQKFIGNYIIWGITPQKTQNNSWQSTLTFQQGFRWMRGKFSLRGIYNHSEANVLQNSQLVQSEYNMLNTTASLIISPYRNMVLSYLLRYSYRDMKNECSDDKTAFCNWQHELSIVVPVNKFRLSIYGDYYHNKIAVGQYKDVFMGNCKFNLNLKHIDSELKVNNIFNKKTYAYSTVANMMTMQNITALRGREIMLSLIYKP